MEIRVYKDFELQGIIENQTSLLWNRKYNDTGSFSMVCPLTTRNVNLLRPGNVVWVEGKVEAGVVESVMLEENSTRQAMNVSGRFLESYLDRRLIRPLTNFSGTTEDAMRTLFTNAAPIPEIVLGGYKGFPETCDIQVAYHELLDIEEKLAKSANFGFRFIPDFVARTITFDIYKGIDHSADQYDRTQVIFSAEFANLTSTNYTYNDQLASNVCYVGGEGIDDTDPQKIYVVAGDDSATGLNRREMFLQGQTSSEGLTIAQYQAKLVEEGNLALANTEVANSFTCTVNPNMNFVYGKNYDLGDIVTIDKSEWGIKKNLRISEATEIYESENPRLEITLGTTLPQRLEV